jgi:hypothetical protein
MRVLSCVEQRILDAGEAGALAALDDDVFFEFDTSRIGMP